MSGNNKPTITLKPRSTGASPGKPPPKPAKPSSLKCVRAQFGFNATEKDELSFNEGDLLYILDDKSDPDWWKARVKGKEGLVPSNCLAMDSKLATPLHDAARRANIELLEECLTNKVPVNSLDRAGNTAVHWASHAGNVECLLKLIESCGDVLSFSIKNRLGDTPLHMAAFKGHATVIDILRDRPKGKIDFEAKNNEGKTAIEVATELETKAALHKWLMSLDENPTNVKLQKMQNASRIASSDYGLSDDESGDSENEK